MLKTGQGLALVRFRTTAVLDPFWPAIWLVWGFAVADAALSPISPLRKSDEPSGFLLDFPHYL